jgi:hypothetical protein
MPWALLQARMSQRLGRDHVADLRFRLGPLRLLRVIDGCVEGKEISRIARSADVGTPRGPGAPRSPRASPRSTRTEHHDEGGHIDVERIPG